MALEMPENLKIALQAAGESAQRCRWALLVLVTASVFAFTANWNSLDGGWIRIRQARLDAAMDNWYSDTNSPAFKDSQQFIEDRFHQGAFYGTKDATSTNAASSTNLLLHLRHLRDDMDDLQNHEVRYIKTAFFSTGFDVNDLGVFTGIGFSILLVILCFSLRREVRNLKFYFELLGTYGPISTKDEKQNSEAKGLLQVGYNLLAMKQVLTLPHVYQDRKSPEDFFWKLMQWFPFLAPFVIQLTILREDFHSFNLGKPWDADKALLLIAYDTAAVFLVGFITYICIKEKDSINKEWSNAYRNAYLNDSKNGH